jgi:hypothetical protein
MADREGVNFYVSGSIVSHFRSLRQGAKPVFWRQFLAIIAFAGQCLINVTSSSFVQVSLDFTEAIG